VQIDGRPGAREPVDEESHRQDLSEASCNNPGDPSGPPQSDSRIPPLPPRRRRHRRPRTVCQHALQRLVELEATTTVWALARWDDLVAALGGCSIAKSEVSRICAELDEELAAFRSAPSTARAPTRTTGSTPLTRRRAKVAASSARPWWSPSAPARPRPSGLTSAARFTAGAGQL